MANFEEALAFVLENEGGFSEDAADPGGATNFGISLRFLNNLAPERLKRYGFFNAITPQVIKDLTREEAALIYLEEFWNLSPFFAIFLQEVANYLFDMAVNLGLAFAIKLLQRVLGFLVEDGIFGAVTLAAVNQVGKSLLPALSEARADYYKALVEQNPKEAVFLKGWLARAARIS